MKGKRGMNQDSAIHFPRLINTRLRFGNAMTRVSEKLRRSTCLTSFVHHWAALCPVVGRMPRHAVSKLAYIVQSSARSCRSSICPGRLSTAWLVSLVVFSWHNGLQVVTRMVHRSSFRRLICPDQDNFIFLPLPIIYTSKEPVGPRVE